MECCANRHSRGCLAEACGLVCPSAWLGADELAHRKGLCDRHLMLWSSITEAVHFIRGRSHSEAAHRHNNHLCQSATMVAPIDLKTGRNDAFEDDRANATSLMGRGATLFDQGQRRRQNLSLTTAEEFRHIRKNIPYGSAAGATPSTSGLSRSETAMNVIQSELSSSVLRFFSRFQTRNRRPAGCRWWAKRCYSSAGSAD